MLLKIFLTFFKIGAFTVGGAYAMIPLIRREVCEKRGWITDEEFLDGLAAAQSCPGPIAINISIYTGYHIRRGAGMAVAVLGTVLPSTISIILIASLFVRYSQAEVVRNAFYGLKPALVALIAVPLAQMAGKAGLKPQNVWIPLLTALLVAFLGVSPVYLILLAIAFSVLHSLRMKDRQP